MLIRSEVRRRPLEFDRTHHGASEVARRVGMAALPQFIECPDHAGGTDVQAG
jgi:hypothetical protein